MTDMSGDPLVKQLRERLGTTEEGYRTAELAELLGESKWRVRKLLHQLDDEGLLQVTWKKVKALDRTVRSVRAYKLRSNLLETQLTEDDNGS